MQASQLFETYCYKAMPSSLPAIYGKQIRNILFGKPLANEYFHINEQGHLSYRNEYALKTGIGAPSTAQEALEVWKKYQAEKTPLLRALFADFEGTTPLPDYFPSYLRPTHALPIYQNEHRNSPYGLPVRAMYWEVHCRIELEALTLKQHKTKAQPPSKPGDKQFLPQVPVSEFLAEVAETIAESPAREELFKSYINATFEDWDWWEYYKTHHKAVLEGEDLVVWIGGGDRILGMEYRHLPMERITTPSALYNPSPSTARPALFYKALPNGLRTPFYLDNQQAACREGVGGEGKSLEDIKAFPHVAGEKGIWVYNLSGSFIEWVEYTKNEIHFVEMDLHFWNGFFRTSVANKEL